MMDRRRFLGVLAAGVVAPKAWGAGLKPGVNGQPRAEIRTPAAPDTPRLNGPKISGVRPGHPFLYRIASTGARPMQFSVRNLPEGLSLDAHSGIISGHAPETAGAYAVEVEASNKKGKARRRFTIKVGETIGLTPQMGWNDWYTYYDHVSDRVIRAAADAMITSGMADYGYQYIDVDDCWATKPGSKDPELNGPARDSRGRILPNKRFPNMLALSNYVHSKGLRFGIYSSPGPLTCGGFEGSYNHEQQDAEQFAGWGVDLLKYDWCSYSKVVKGNTLSDFEEPYQKMGAHLRHLDRDIVFNLCQYGQKDVWKWGRQVGGNSWRTTGDVGTTAKHSLPAFYTTGLANAMLSEYAGPGGWNDPDYIVIGRVGEHVRGQMMEQREHLTPEEQYSYMSMWSLMAAPLIFSGDMEELDPFTLNILCNSEVIEIDQDSLGKQAAVVRKTDDELVLSKPLEGGDRAVGLFNLTSTPRKMSIPWSDIHMEGRQEVRDVWHQRRLGSFANDWSSEVPPRDVALIRIAPVSRQERSAT